MKIGLVIHGPEAVDSGQAKKIIEILSKKGNVTSMIAGTMGKTAVIDAHMENTIDINRSLKPSECIEECTSESANAFILKTRISHCDMHGVKRHIQHKNK